jgi:hypothetical protein
MVLTELDPWQSQLIGALTLTAIKHLGTASSSSPRAHACPEWRMARIADVALLEKPADDLGPKPIDCYQVVEHSASGPFKLDPTLLIYSLRWKYNVEPPDFEMVLIQDEPAGWVNTANLTLLTELRRCAPHAIDWAGMQDVMPLLDAFGAAMDNRIRATALTAD